MQRKGLESMALRAAMLLAAVLLPVQPATSVELGRSQSGTLEATLTDKSLQVQGVTSGGEVAYLGVSHEEVQESWGRLHRYAGVLTDDDANGEVEFAPESGISTMSIWVVVDLTSGDVLNVSPDASKRRFPEALELQVSPDNRVIAADRFDLELLLHRPGLGVWIGKGVDGGQGDDSLHADGKLRVDLSVFRSLRGGGPAAPPVLRPGDRLLAIDLQHLDAVSVEFE